MIDLAPPVPPISRSLLDARGGFVWWYLDLVDANGDGIVLIWSFGLPFLPGYTQAAREGTAPPARARPSIALSVYVGGVCDFYLLQEYPQVHATWDLPERVRIGDSTFETATMGATRVVQVELDMPVPRMDTRVRGRLRAEGPSRQPSPLESPAAAHHWSPLLCCAEGEVELSQGDWSFSRRGRVYHDRNGSPTHLDGMGIASWVWARVAFPGYELVVYHLLPTGGGAPTEIVLKVDDQGRTRAVPDAQIRLKGAHRHLWGLTWYDQLEVQGQAMLKLPRVVDGSSFYLRMPVEGVDAQGATGRGWAELVSPHDVDLPGWRPLVKMAVHPVRGAESVWLPLFSGPRDGRVSRLFRRG